MTGLADETERDRLRQMSDDLIDLHLQHLHDVGSPRSTIDSRRLVLRMLHNRLPFGLVMAARDQIEAWLGDLRTRGRAKATISNYQYHAGEFYKWACREGYLDGDPMLGMPRIRVPRKIPNPVTEDELATLLTLAEPLLTAVILGAFAGLRRFEIAICMREHVSQDVILVPHGKGDKPATVPTHPYLWEHVRGRPPGILVTDKAGRPVEPNWLSKTVRYACDAIGLPDVHLHRLRDRYGTMIQELYGDLRVTQECLRHESVKSTEGYTLVRPGRRGEAVTKLPVPAIPKRTGPATD